MDTKKNRERVIFDSVYYNRLLDSVIPTEEPDFKVKNAYGQFGVEITEFYFSHSEARIKNIPSYAEEILEEKKYRHKDDIASLEVKEVTVLPNDNRSPSFKVDAIIQEWPSIYSYVNKISEVIEHKNKRFKKYIIGLNHVNLIISDCINSLLGNPISEFHHLFFQEQLEKVLMKTDFREIYFITQLGEFNASKSVYIPLKMMFLVAEIFLFNHILVREYSDNLMNYSERRAQICAEYLTWRGAKNIYFKDSSEGCEVTYGNSGVFISKDNSVSIKDYSDSILPVDFNLATVQEVSGFFDNTFLRLFEKYKHESVFSTELCFDVAGSK